MLEYGEGQAARDQQAQLPAETGSNIVRLQVGGGDKDMQSKQVFSVPPSLLLP